MATSPPTRHLGSRSGRLWSSLEPTSKLRSDVCRTLHYDKRASLKMLHEALGDDLSHDLVRVVDALAGAPLARQRRNHLSKIALLFRSLRTPTSQVGERRDCDH